MGKPPGELHGNNPSARRSVIRDLPPRRTGHDSSCGLTQDFLSAGNSCDARSEAGGIAVANRHVNKKEMAVHVPAVSRNSLSIVIPSETFLRKATQRWVISQFAKGSNTGDIRISRQPGTREAGTSTRRRTTGGAG
jgi:hypothetical protein